MVYDNKLGILLDAPAKVNLGLYVGKKYKNRHRIYTVIAPLSLHDELLIKPNNEHTVNIYNKGIELNIPLEENAIYKAYQVLKSRYEIPGVDVYLNKQIPVCSGLGGESSDVATMLAGCARLFNLDVVDTMFDMGAELGSDAVAFLFNEACSQKGLYTHIRPLHKSFNEDVYLIIPKLTKPSTKEMYERIDQAVKLGMLSYFDKTKSFSEDENMFEYVSPVKDYLKRLREVAQGYNVKLNLVGSGNAIMMRGRDQERFITALKNETSLLENVSILQTHIE